METKHHTTTHHRPPAKVSAEADQEQLGLAKEQGDAYGRALAYMTNAVARGGQRPAGDYVVAYAVEKAEGMYDLVDGKLVWREPDDANLHIEVAVTDAADGRFIPGLTVSVTLADGADNTLGPYVQPFLWHPSLYHYGRNWTVPRDGEYTLRVHIDPPTFPRHDKVNGRRYANPVDVEFPRVRITTGRS